MPLETQELKKLNTYKDMAYRSLRFLYRHPKIGEDKLRDWVEEWIIGFFGEIELERFLPQKGEKINAT